METYTWADGDLIKGRKQIDSLNYSLHYSSPSAWEGIRSYKQQDGSTVIWKLDEHVQRLFDTAKILNFEIPYTKPELIRACKEVVKANGSGDLYLRPVVYSSDSAKSATPSEGSVCVDIYAFPLEKLHKKPVKLMISNYKRGYPQFNMQAKTAANYQILQSIKNELKGDIDDILLTDNSDHITEASVANIYVFKGNVAYTPPNDGSILPGITRGCVADLLQNQQLMILKYKKPTLLFEKKITKADLYTADCVILCGTFTEVTQVSHIDGRRIGDDTTQFYYNMLRDEYQSLIRGVASRDDSDVLHREGYGRSKD